MHRTEEVCIARVDSLTDVVATAPTRIDVDRVHESVVRSRADVTSDGHDVFTTGHTTSSKQILQFAELDVLDTGSTVRNRGNRNPCGDVIEKRIVIRIGGIEVQGFDGAVAAQRLKLADVTR